MAKKKLGKKVQRRKRPPIKRITPLWELEKDGITYSGLSTWLQCREQFALKWIDGLISRKVSTALEFGSLFHAALEYQFAAPPEEVIGRLAAFYRKKRIPKLTSSSEKDAMELVVGLAERTFPQYCRFWQEDDRLLSWVGREEKFSVPHDVPMPDGTTRRISLRGMRDGLYESRNVFGLFETKTKSVVSETEIMDSLYSDLQTMMYAYATYLSESRLPNQCIYNVVRRATTYRGKTESLKSYLDKVEEDIVSRPEFYFMRYEVWINKDDMDLFVNKTLNPILALFIQWWDSIKKNPIDGRFQSPYHYLNSTALVSKFGKADMWDAIFGEMSPYDVRDSVYPELDESIPDLFAEQETEALTIEV